MLFLTVGKQYEEEEEIKQSGRNGLKLTKT